MPPVDLKNLLILKFLKKNRPIVTAGIEWSRGRGTDRKCSKLETIHNCSHAQVGIVYIVRYLAS